MLDVPHRCRQTAFWLSIRPGLIVLVPNIHRFLGGEICSFHSTVLTEVQFLYDRPVRAETDPTA
jgi:hypothetical protein